MTKLKPACVITKLLCQHQICSCGYDGENALIKENEGLRHMVHQLNQEMEYLKARLSYDLEDMPEEDGEY